KRAYCLKTQPATGETYPKSDLFNKASPMRKFIGDHLLKFMPDKAFALHSAVQLFSRRQNVVRLMPK
ncbi:hypothetical protein, partial [Escherichia coli]